MTETSFQVLPHIVVIGAGVIGLSTAIKIQEGGRYTTTVISELFPEDVNHPERSSKYTSSWAGAIQTGFPPKNSLLYRAIEETFHTMWDLSAPDNPAAHCFLRVPLKYHALDNSEESEAYKMPWYADTKVSHGPDQKGMVIQVNTVTVEPARYLPYLMTRFRGAGGRTVRGTVKHLDQLFQGNFEVEEIHGNMTQESTEKLTRLSPPEAVIVCAGLGSRILGGVEDSSMHPVRGQTVFIKAPWIKVAQMKEEEDGGETYIFPRRSGEVVLGGIYTPNDWFDQPRTEIKDDILRRTLKLCPELVPSEVLEEGNPPTVDDLRNLIIGEGCGLRPGRTGGIRLEVDLMDSKYGPDQSSRKTPVIYNYGHTGLGYSSSWGSASRALELLEEALVKV
ncbi:nucleotide-binding domain-containing protein [Dendrothele bispora CBS 962.96]|uniref:Nucleotide-binding domain-containing protein n=1 Tax=Dendrothele bispora (strain CBS 962.96) TaxID=1314807 RepID=A0A4V4HCW8_DENBC|nr:nucleotide-binding domain-containing protein [Dendrothele bispora CBS 962.96]